MSTAGFITALKRVRSESGRSYSPGSRIRSLEQEDQDRETRTRIAEHHRGLGRIRADGRRLENMQQGRIRADREYRQAGAHNGRVWVRGYYRELPRGGRAWVRGHWQEHKR